MHLLATKLFRKYTSEMLACEQRGETYSQPNLRRFFYMLWSQVVAATSLSALAYGQSLCMQHETLDGLGYVDEAATFKVRFSARMP